MNPNEIARLVTEDICVSNGLVTEPRKTKTVAALFAEALSKFFPNITENFVITNLGIVINEDEVGSEQHRMEDELYTKILQKVVNGFAQAVQSQGSLMRWFKNLVGMNKAPNEKDVILIMKRVISGMHELPTHIVQQYFDEANLQKLSKAIVDNWQHLVTRDPNWAEKVTRNVSAMAYNKRVEGSEPI